MAKELITKKLTEVMTASLAGGKFLGVTSSGGLAQAPKEEYILNSEKGTANGVATLDAQGKLVQGIDESTLVKKTDVGVSVAPLATGKLPNANLNFGTVSEGNANVVSGGDVYEKMPLTNNYLNVDLYFPSVTKYTFSRAVSVITDRFKKQGLVIFFTNASNEVEHWEFNSTMGNFNNLSYWRSRINLDSCIKYNNVLALGKQKTLNGIKRVYLKNLPLNSELFVRTASSVISGPTLTKTVDFQVNSVVVSRAVFSYNLETDFGIKTFPITNVGVNGFSGEVTVDLSEMNKGSVISTDISPENGFVYTVINTNVLYKESVLYTDANLLDNEIGITSESLVSKRFSGSTKRFFNFENLGIFSSEINKSFLNKSDRMLFVNSIKKISLSGNFKAINICLYSLNYSTNSEGNRIVNIELRNIDTNTSIASHNSIVNSSDFGKILDFNLTETNRSGINGVIQLDLSLTTVNVIGSSSTVRSNFKIAYINDLNSSSGISEVNWGDIKGDINLQLDLKKALGSKQDNLQNLNRLVDLSGNDYFFRYGNYIIDKSKNVVSRNTKKMYQKSYDIKDENFNENAYILAKNNRYYGTKWLASQLRDILVSDNLSTWTKICEVGAFPTGIFELGDGELLITTQPNGAYRLPSETGLWRTFNNKTEARQVLRYTTPMGQEGATSITPEWSVSISDNIIVVNEYGGVATTGSESGVFISRDYGVTFDKIFSLQENTTNGFLNKPGDDKNRIHLHGVCYDPFWKRIWMCTGDSSEYLCWTDDFGVTWKKLDLADYDLDGNLRTLQFINIFPMQDYIILATDGDLQSIFRIQRKNKEDIPVIEEAYRFNNQNVVYQFVSNYYVDENTGVLYVSVGYGDARIPTNDIYRKSFVLATHDGITWHKIWECKNLTEYGVKRLHMIVRDKDIIIEQMDNKGLAAGYTNRSRYYITKPIFH